MSTLIRTGGGGADLSVVTAAASDVLASKVIVDSSGNPLTGTIASKGVATITPGTTNQTIAAGQYLTGVQTILGDADLISANIKSGIDIFGVTGTVDLFTTFFPTYIKGRYSVPVNGAGSTVITSAKKIIAAFVFCRQASDDDMEGAYMRMNNGSAVVVLCGGVLSTSNYRLTTFTLSDYQVDVSWTSLTGAYTIDYLIITEA